MLSEQTLSNLNALRLFGMAKGFSERLSHPKCAELSHEEFLGQDEKTYRENLRLKRLLKNAKLKQPAAMEDIDYKHPRGVNKQLILELSSAQWIENHRSVLLSGPTGVGKTELARALAAALPVDPPSRSFAPETQVSVYFIESTREEDSCFSSSTRARFIHESTSPSDPLMLSASLLPID